MNDIITIRDTADLKRLAARICDPPRRGSLVILSTRFRDGQPGFEPERVHAALPDTPLYVVSGARMARLLNTLTQGRVCCYDGAASVVWSSGTGRTVIPSEADSFDYLIRQVGYQDAPPLRRRHTITPPVAWWPHTPEGAVRWLDLAVEVAWASVVAPEDKNTHDLPDSWSYAPGFAVQVRDAADRTVLLRLMVMILIGDKPSSKRVHYTHRPDGSIVFLTAQERA